MLGQYFMLISVRKAYKFILGVKGIKRVYCSPARSMLAARPVSLSHPEPAGAVFSPTPSVISQASCGSDMSSLIWIRSVTFLPGLAHVIFIPESRYQSRSSAPGHITSPFLGMVRSQSSSIDGGPVVRFAGAAALWRCGGHMFVLLVVIFLFLQGIPAGRAGLLVDLWLWQSPGRTVKALGVWSGSEDQSAGIDPDIPPPPEMTISPMVKAV